MTSLSGSPLGARTGVDGWSRECILDDEVWASAVHDRSVPAGPRREPDTGGLEGVEEEGPTVSWGIEPSL